MFWFKKAIKTIICSFVLSFGFYPPCEVYASDFSLLGAQYHDENARVLIGGWYQWEPYQYLKINGNNDSLTGLDVELQRMILNKAGFNVDITPVSWKQHQEDLLLGARDYAVGAFFSTSREASYYISEPYRFEENSVLALNSNKAVSSFSSSKEFIDLVKRKNLKVGVIDGYRYANEDLNQFIADPENAGLIVKKSTDNQNIRLLLDQVIDVVLADRVAISNIVWQLKLGSEIKEISLNAKAPIHMLLSKKTMSAEDLDKINEAIREIKKSSEYAQVLSGYLYPILLLETTESRWFKTIELLGIIAFALSGLVVAYSCNASLFGTFILALLPSFGGGMMRDVFFGRYPIGFMLSKYYIILVVVIVVVGFFAVRIFMGLTAKSTSTAGASPRIKTFLSNALVVTDAIGLAAFTVTGVLICVIVKADPLWIWGPFFAFLTGAGGGILRDIAVKGAKVEAIHGQLYPEVSVIWGGVLSCYLYFSIYEVDAFRIEMVVHLTILFTFLTRLFIHFYQIPNLFIREQNHLGDDK